MRICVAQAKPLKGDIRYNIDNHKKIIALATSYGADRIIFPELSLTGYEPQLAGSLAMDVEDSRLNGFQEISDTFKITIGLGAPIKEKVGTCIGMILFGPGEYRQLYSKKYLHADEEEFFISGNNAPGSITGNPGIAFAICYEISVAEHSENASKNGAGVYIASVAKSAAGIEKAVETLSAVARNYSMTVLLSNSVGYSDNFESGGKTSAWNKKGLLLGQLSDINEGILIFDTITGELIMKEI